MATQKKKAVTKKTSKKAVAKRGSTNLATNDTLDWLAGLAKDESAREIGGDLNPSLSIRAGKFSLSGELLGDELEVVIVEFAHVKSMYDRPFDPEDSTAPDCFAASLNPDEAPLAPDPKRVREPRATACDGCEFNEFGTADRGKGKACKDLRHLMVLAADDLDTFAAGGEVQFARLSVPATSLKNWARYTKSIQGKLHRPMFSVVTHLEFDPEFDYPVLMFSMSAEINDMELLPKLNEQREAFRDGLLNPWTQSAEDEAPAPSARKNAPKTSKKTSKKAGASKFSRR